MVATLTFCMNLQGQSNLSGEVVYEASYDKTLIEETSLKNKDGIEGANKIIEDASSITATLRFNTNESSYQLDKKLKIDENGELNITFFFAGGDNLFYHNKDSLSLFQTNTSLGKMFLIRRDLPNWVITKETKKIDDLICFKAYSVIPNEDDNTSEKIGAVAWFCPSIPISYGPMEFFGLPGLIIELHYSKMTFIAQKINLNKKNVIIEKPLDAEIITVKEFNVLARKKIPSFFEN